MSTVPSGGGVQAWRQLLRAANVFTAASNVMAGFLIVQGDWEPAPILAVLVLSSACLYEAGMVLNDVFDRRLDAIERPERPIPAGRISLRTAAWAGWALLTAGVACGWWASWLAGHGTAGLVASLLAVAVVQYDSGLKRMWAAPLAMGWCRLLNVLLGASVARDLSQRYDALGYAMLVGAYAVVLTHVARAEATGTPAEMQHRRRIVTRMIQGFIVLDAAAAALAAGWPAGFAVLSLLVPTLALARRTPMT